MAAPVSPAAQPAHRPYPPPSMATSSISSAISLAAVGIQIRIAIAVYVLMAIVKKQLHLDLSLYTILQILSVTLFEKKPILEAFSIIQPQESERVLCNQLTLFD